MAAPSSLMVLTYFALSLVYATILVLIIFRLSHFRKFQDSLVKCFYLSMFVFLAVRTGTFIAECMAEVPYSIQGSPIISTHYLAHNLFFVGFSFLMWYGSHLSVMGHSHISVPLEVSKHCAVSIQSTVFTLASLF